MRKNIALIIIAGLIISGIYLLLGLEEGEDRAEDTLCPAGTELIPRHTIIVIDQSTEFSDAQKEIVRDNVLSLIKYNLLKANEKVSLFHMYGTPRALKPTFQRCWIEVDTEAINADRLKEEYQDPFEHQLGVSVDSLLAKGNEDIENSPLFEWFEQIALWVDFQPDNYESRRLIFISDMIHSNNSFSMYKHRNNSPNNFSKNTSFDYWKNNDSTRVYFDKAVKLDFKGTVNFAIIHFENTTHGDFADLPSAQEVKDFWIKYLKNSGIDIDPKRGCQRSGFEDCWDTRYRGYQDR